MKQEIELARMLSARLRRYLKAKQQLGELLYVELSNDIKITAHLKEAMSRLEGEILILRFNVKEAISTLPKYSKKKHIEIDYISLPDLKNKVIDISINGDGTQILDLETGEICESSPNR